MLKPLCLLVFLAATCSAQQEPLHAPQTQPMESHQAHTPPVPSTTLTLTAEGKATTYSAADLQAMPQHTVTVHNGHSNADEIYTGVAVSDLLAKSGLSMQGDGAKKVYHSYLRAQGTDGYFVLFSTSELEAAMHQGEVIVALTVDGKPLTTDGQYKLVSTEDKRPARWVRNLAALTLVPVQ